MPDFNLENQFVGKTVAGVDEAGRGPWAGPVVASAVRFYEHCDVPDTLKDLNDSKKLSSKKRERLYQSLWDLKGQDLDFGVGVASVEEIDQHNILQATFLAMERALHQLPFVPDIVLIDGAQKHPRFPQSHAIIQGDGKSLSIAAASIIAKVTRDHMMTDLSHEHPSYKWEKNAGYGTKDHQQALQAYGITPHHRRSFAPIKKIIAGAL